MNAELYNNVYEAKFAREAKNKPTNWIIKPCKGVDRVELIDIGSAEQPIIRSA